MPLRPVIIGLLLVGCASSNVLEPQDVDASTFTIPSAASIDGHWIETSLSDGWRGGDELRFATAILEEESAPLLPPRYGLARTASVQRVTVFQTVGVDLFVQGEEPEDVPLLMGQSARLRVYVEGGEGQLLLARVRWRSGASETVFAVAKEISSDGDDDALGGVFEFELSPEIVGPESSVLVELIENGGDSFIEVAESDSSARVPRDGVPLEVQPELGHPLKLVLLPFLYGFDASERAPDTSTASVVALEEHVEAVFPIGDAQISVATPVLFDGELPPDSFDAQVAVLEEVLRWRSDQTVADDVYVMGLITPTESFREYCRLGCFTGVAPRNESNSPFQRIGLTVWYGPETSAWTALHELAHAHGRAHAPCGGPTGEDPAYPQPDGSIGRAGFDRRVAEFIPSSAPDFLSYCRDEWISAYTYAALAERVRAVSDAPSAARRGLERARHHFVTVSDEGVRWSEQWLVPASLDDRVERLVATDVRGRAIEVLARRIVYSANGSASWVFSADTTAQWIQVAEHRLRVPE